MYAGGGRNGSNVNYVRQVPKFLQGHMHLLGARTDEDVQEQLTAKREMPQWDSEEDDAAEKEASERPQYSRGGVVSRGTCIPGPGTTENSLPLGGRIASHLVPHKQAFRNVQDALRRAVAQDASLAEQYPELANLVAKNEAAAEKEKGNKAFSEKRSALSLGVHCSTNCRKVRRTIYISACCQNQMSTRFSMPGMRVQSMPGDNRSCTDRYSA